MTLLLIRRGPNLAAQALPEGPSGEHMLLMLAGAMVAGDAATWSGAATPTGTR